MQANPPGPKGITPLHLAALQKQGSGLPCLITAHCGLEAWLDCLTDDGTSPSEFARLAGNQALDDDVRAKIRQQRLQIEMREKESCQRQSHESRHRAISPIGWTTAFGSPTNSTSSKETELFLDSQLHGHSWGLHVSKSGQSHDHWDDDDSAVSETESPLF